VILKLHLAKLQYSHSELTIFLDRRNIGCPLPRKILQGEIHDSDACSRNLPAGMRGGHLVVFDKRKKSAWRDPDCGASAVDRSSGVLYKDMQLAEAGCLLIEVGLAGICKALNCCVNHPY
jgi:hypothetical protein